MKTQRFHLREKWLRKSRYVHTRHNLLETDLMDNNLTIKQRLDCKGKDNEEEQ
jgi:hypothetical protein